MLLLPAACADRDPPMPEFNQDRAWSHLVAQVSFGPRYPGSRGHAWQLAWLMEQLTFLADTVVQQKFTAAGEGGRRLELTNVVASFRPELRERVLLVANLDTRRRADRSPEPLDRRLPVPGANVNASGVALLVELATMFWEQPPPVGIDLLLADGDDYSNEVQMAGTNHFVRSMPGYRPRYAVVVQAVADVEPRFPVDTSAAPARRLWAVARRLRQDSLFAARAESGAAADQGAVLEAAGIPTLVVADREYGPLNLRWHSKDDMPQFLSAATLARTGHTLAALLYTETPAEAR
ncbi:MAG TPA: M28 family peptidase [Longimicrobium sp.]|nr:M28 family peptidase [Longimicrobium sp.]